MNINDMDFIKLIPSFMKEDEAVQGLSESVNKATERLMARIKLFSTWNRIDEMSAAELDMLAEELHIDWYDKTASLDVKRELIKNSDMVHAKMGTNWAVQNVINTYFGYGKIEDWYEYDGEPYHFRVITSNQNITDSEAEKFLSVLDKVKRKSAFMDEIEVVSNIGDCKIHVFLISCETETITSHITVNVQQIPAVKGTHEYLAGFTHDQLSEKTHEKIGGN